MKNVISASRRTDLVAHFPEWLASVVKQEKAQVLGPSRRLLTVDLNPQSVHTFVLWSKDFSNLIENRSGMKDGLQKYDQVYCHFTITGLGGSAVERGVPPPERAISQIKPLVEFAGSPDRVSVRFDPVVFWEEGGGVKTNLSFFEKLAPELHGRGIRNVRFSFTQWYAKARKRAARRGFAFVDPSSEKKKEDARYLAEIAGCWGLTLFACSQKFLTSVPRINGSSCIDGGLLQSLHPSLEPASLIKDRSQRKECGCTESMDIGSYAFSCPHSCLYCYANPGI